MADFIHENIKVMGIGLAGCNVINRMISEGMEGIEFIGINSTEELEKCSAKTKLNLGLKDIKELGQRRDFTIGEDAAKNNLGNIIKALHNTDMLFIVCAMGGRIGAGATPVIAEIANAMGILTIGIISEPFPFERKLVKEDISNQITKLVKSANTTILLPNDDVCKIIETISFKEAFEMMDKKFLLAVQGLSDLLIKPGDINLEFSDIKTVIYNGGPSLIGTGYGNGKDKVMNATKKAIEEIEKHYKIKKAKKIILNITGGNDINTVEIKQAASLIENMINKKTDFMWGISLNKGNNKTVKATIIVTGV